MLDQAKLKDNIKKTLDDVLPKAFETAFKKVLPSETDDGNKKAKDFGECVNEMVSDSLAEGLSCAIDAYVKNAKIFGKFMIMGITTQGSMVAQAQAVPLTISVDSMPTGLGGGNMPLPNSLMLGIQ